MRRNLYIAGVCLPTKVNEFECNYCKAVFILVNTGGPPLSTVSTSTISTSTNFSAIGIKLVLVESWWNFYVVKLVLVEIGYVELTSTNFA